MCRICVCICAHIVLAFSPSLPPSHPPVLHPPFLRCLPVSSSRPLSCTHNTEMDDGDRMLTDGTVCVAARRAHHQRHGSGNTPCLCALYVCLICVPCICALYVCLVCMPCMYVCLVCMPCMYVCLVCMPYMCALYVCVPCMCALYVCLVCVPQMRALYV